MKNTHAFTLLEVIVVMIIIGVVVGFAIPGFQGSINQGRANDAQNALLSIYSAQLSRNANGTGFYTASASCSASTVTDDGSLNSTLGISIVRNNSAFCCTTVSGDGGFTCYADLTSGGFKMRVVNTTVNLTGKFDATGRNPICFTGTCP